MDKIWEYEGHLSSRGLSKCFVQDCIRMLGVFNSFVRSCGVMSDAEITIACVEEYRRYVAGRLNERTGRPLSVLYVRSLLSVVMKYFDWRVLRGELLMNPTGRWVLPAPVRGLPRYIPSASEMESLLAWPSLVTDIGVRDRAVFEVFYSTGIRRKELMGLDIYDVDLKLGTLRVRMGKGNKDRVVPLGCSVSRSLSLYLRTSRNSLLKDKRQEALFVSWHGRRIGRNEVDSLVRRYSRAALPDRHITCHTFRHAFATHMMRGGADIRRVQAMLGHENIASTEIYTRVFPAEVKAMHHACHPRG